MTAFGAQSIAPRARFTPLSRRVTGENKCRNPVDMNGYTPHIESMETGRRPQQRETKMTIRTKDGNEVRDIAARFDITEDQATRIAEKAADEAEFIRIWENEAWWV